MHEYARNPTFDSVTERRVDALAAFGLTQRQRQFLVAVMVHAGCFLERQYCAFTSTVRGQNSREFVSRLVARGFARAIEPGPIRRGRLYHVITSRSMRRSASRTTAIVGCSRWAGWWRGS